MRAVCLVAAAWISGACAAGPDVRAAAPAQDTPAAGAELPSIDAERSADDAAYRTLYLPERARLIAEAPGRWLAIVGGRLVPADGTLPAPAPTMEEAVAAASAAAPGARHRFVFKVGGDGDLECDLGGCELPRVLGTQFLALLERRDVMVRFSTKRPSVQFISGDTARELATRSEDGRMFLAPDVGPPGSEARGGRAYCVSTGFGGLATMPQEDAKGLELWEIPGVARVTGVMQSGECRRAWARFRWPNTPLDFVVPVAIWPPK